MQKEQYYFQNNHQKCKLHQSSSNTRTMPTSRMRIIGRWEYSCICDPPMKENALAFDGAIKITITIITSGSITNFPTFIVVELSVIMTIVKQEGKKKKKKKKEDNYINNTYL